MKRRWPLALLAGLLLLFVLAAGVTLFSARSLEGAVPGRSPILALAAIPAGYLAGTEGGLFVSSDGRKWSKPGRFSGRRALVTGGGLSGAVVLSGDRLWRTSNLTAFTRVPGRRLQTTALAGGSGGAVFVWTPPGRIQQVLSPPSDPGAPESASGVKPPKASAKRSAPPGPQRGREPKAANHLRPREVIAIDVVEADPPFFFAGGLRSGVWRSFNSDSDWQQVLKTPARAIMADEARFRRIFIGTAAGILFSDDKGLSWSFTGLRSPVEALAQFNGAYFALGQDRLMYTSSNGRTWKPAVPAARGG